MKAKEIEQKILETNRLFRDACSFTQIAELAAGEIAVLCDVDKNDALQVQDATWHDIEDKHLADLATAQAQVAVMAEALEQARKALQWAWGTIHQASYDEPLDDDDRGEALEKLDMAIKSVKALSAAPKVVWSGDAAWDTSDEFRDPSRKGPILWFPFSAALETGRTQLPLTEEDGKVVNVIVLDKQGEGE